MVAANAALNASIEELKTLFADSERMTQESKSSMDRLEQLVREVKQNQAFHGQILRNILQKIEGDEELLKKVYAEFFPINTQISQLSNLIAADKSSAPGNGAQTQRPNQKVVLSLQELESIVARKVDWDRTNNRSLRRSTGSSSLRTEGVQGSNDFEMAVRHLNM